MSELEDKMICFAESEHQKIYPCSDRKKLSDCFTRHENRLFFWFNTEDCSTHILSSDKIPKDVPVNPARS